MKATALYAALDAMILKAIQEGNSPLYNMRVAAEASAIAEATGREDFRVIDGRLQALRKRGVIKFHREWNRWVEVEK